MPVRAVCKPHSPDLKRGALATDARGCSLWRSLLERPPPTSESRVRDPLRRVVAVWTRYIGYIGAVTWMGVRFRGVSVTDVAMPVRAVCKPHSPDLKRGALATDARGCSLWRSLLERPPPTSESRVRDPLRRVVAVWTRYIGYIGAVTWMGVRFRGVSVTDVAMPVRAVCKPHSPIRRVVAVWTQGVTYIYIYIYKSCTNYFFFKCVGLLETWGMVMCKYFFLATIYISDDSVCTASLILEVALFDTQ